MSVREETFSKVREDLLPNYSILFIVKLIFEKFVLQAVALSRDIMEKRVTLI